MFHATTNSLKNKNSYSKKKSNALQSVRSNHGRLIKIWEKRKQFDARYDTRLQDNMICRSVLRLLCFRYRQTFTISSGNSDCLHVKGKK